MKPIDLHPDARRDWEGSAAFYAKRGRKLASDFNQRVWGTLHEIALDPCRFPVVQDMRPLRKYRLGRFPFTILYIEHPDKILVIAIAHGSRHPGFWTDRLHS